MGFGGGTEIVVEISVGVGVGVTVIMIVVSLIEVLLDDMIELEKEM